jgi:hypothetical protein
MQDVGGLYAFKVLHEAGSHLDQATFHARYEARLSALGAELIGGVALVPSSLR